jgi:hypothetical protein
MNTNAGAFAKQSHLMPLVRRRDGDIHVHRLWKRDGLSNNDLSLTGRTRLSAASPPRAVVDPIENRRDPEADHQQSDQAYNISSHVSLR